MAHATPLTKLEKRTAVLLTIIGIMGSLLGIIGIAVPYFLANIIGAGLCDDQCMDMKVRDTQLTHAYYITAAIIILSIVVSFLPRIIYGAKVRRARRQRTLVNKEEPSIQP